MLTTLAGPKSGASSPDRRISTRRVSATGMRQRDFVPGEARRAHVDAVGPGAEALAGDQPGRGLDRQRLGARLARQPVGDAARAVATGAGLAAVVVVDADEGERSRRRAGR